MTNINRAQMNGMRRRGSIDHNDLNENMDNTGHFQDTHVISNLSISRAQEI